MKNTIKFTTPVIFGLSTVLADMNSLECAIDVDNKIVYTNDVDGFKTAFDNGGIDPEEFIVEPANKSDYNKLIKKLEAEKIKEEQEAEKNNQPELDIAE